MGEDFRLVWRGLRRKPGFAAIAVLTFALGIGASTAIFTVADATLRRSLPYPDADRIVTLTETNQRERWSEIEASYPNLVDWRSQSASFSAMGGFAAFGSAVLATPDGAENVPAGLVGGDFFAVLGVPAALGRTLLPSDDPPEAPRVVVLTDAFWRERFGADREIVGRTLSLNDQTYVVVGVLPPRFAFAPLGDRRLYMAPPLQGQMAQRRNLHWLTAVARLAPGVSLTQAQAEMSAIAGRLALAYPDANAGSGVRVAGLDEAIVGKVRPIVLLVLAAVGLLLAVACANVANLILARATGRRKEMAIRAALGAGRWPLVRLVTTEGVSLALAGAAAGSLLAVWGVDALVSLIPPQQLATMPYLARLAVDPLALAFAFVLALVIGVVVSVVPALLASRPDVQAVLAQEGRATASRGRARFRDAFVAIQVAVAFVLLVSAALISRSLARVLAVDPGFDTRNLLSLQVRLPSLISGDADRLATHERLLARVAELPGVTGTASVNVLPLTGGAMTTRFVVDGRPDPGPGRATEANLRKISGAYFSVMGVPIIAGRAFTGADGADAPAVVIVNQTLANAVFPGENPVGQRIRFTARPGAPPVTIVGVAGDERIATLDVDPPPALYFPWAQSSGGALSMVVRGGVDEATVRRALIEVEPRAAVFDVATFDDRIARAPWMLVRRLPAVLVGVFAAMALLLALVGIYGVLAYAVAERTHEIGIRRAVGATGADIITLVVGRAMRVVAFGLGAGLVFALIVGRLLRGFLYQVAPHDGWTLAGSAVVLLVVALAASLVPARRAFRVDPMEALR